MSVPRAFVVGDVHGCADELDALLDAIAPVEGDTVVFLGDYIDRGPDSKGVVERLIRLRGEGPNCVFLRGNHEDMLLAFLGRGGSHGDVFLDNGGAVTLESYGLVGVSGEALAQRMAPEHLEFFASLRMHYSCEGFLCVHAGVNPRRPLERQRGEDLLWIREQFTSRRHEFPLTVVYGHTPYREVFVDLPYKIGLDTGCVYRNKLSCLELRERRVFQVHRFERTVRSFSLEPGGAPLRA